MLLEFSDIFPFQNVHLHQINIQIVFRLFIPHLFRTKDVNVGKKIVSRKRSSTDGSDYSTNSYVLYSWWPYTHRQVAIAVMYRVNSFNSVLVNTSETNICLSLHVLVTSKKILNLEISSKNINFRSISIFGVSFFDSSFRVERIEFGCWSYHLMFLQVIYDILSVWTWSYKINDFGWKFTSVSVNLK